MNHKHCSIFLAAGSLLACQPQTSNNESTTQPVVSESSYTAPLTFSERQIIGDAKYFWAHTASDISGDGLADLVFINNNSSGGVLGYYKGQKEDGMWEKVIIAETPPTGGLFAGGDLEVADIDGDGDIDVLGIKHPGEWVDAGASAEIFWYENTDNGWQAHAIGEVPDAVKDINFTDFDKDGLMDLAILTFESNTLSIFKQNTSDDWALAQFIQNTTLHEGMDTGDFNNDGYMDIVANAYVFYNPNGKLEQTWRQQNLNEMWNSQEGDWSRNGTKTFAADNDGDGIDEIFMCHSERKSYPLVMYTATQTDDLPTWKESEILPEITACHTLQVYDFDLDGDKDIFTGTNFARAVNIEEKNFDMKILLNNGSTYDTMVLHKQGVYNGVAIDFEGDGDMDLFRYPNHESTDLFLYVNDLK